LLVDNLLASSSQTPITSQLHVETLSSSDIERLARDITAVVVGYALKDFMGHMSSHVPSQDIVRRITQEQVIGSRFVEFKDVMVTMVESYAYEVSLYQTYIRINTEDILRLRAQRLKQKVLPPPHDLCVYLIIPTLSLYACYLSSIKLTDIMEILTQ
jgi:hypothetical protein